MCNPKDRDIHHKVKHHWEKNAERWFLASEKGYDIVRNFVNTPAFLNFLPDISNHYGVDIGYGDGYNTRLIAQRCKHLTAVDLADTFHQYNTSPTKKNSNITFLKANAVEMPFPDKHFDFAVATMSFMDMGDHGRVFREIFRILKTNGFLQFSILHPCFNPVLGKWVYNDNGERAAFLCKRYFWDFKGEIQKWMHRGIPDEERKNFQKFSVPRFTKTFSGWLNLLIKAGFVLEAFLEPKASEDAVKLHPELASTHIVAHSLIIRVKKNQ